MCCLCFVSVPTSVQELRPSSEYFAERSTVPSWIQPGNTDPTADCCVPALTCSGNIDSDRYPDVQCDSNNHHLNALKPGSDHIFARTQECCCTCEPNLNEMIDACVPAGLFHRNLTGPQPAKVCATLCTVAYACSKLWRDGRLLDLGTAS
eukprot:COSAG02_NODE_2774_length_8057_cov_4.361146_3_plen_150_part_00